MTCPGCLRLMPSVTGEASRSLNGGKRLPKPLVGSVQACLEAVALLAQTSLCRDQCLVVAACLWDIECCVWHCHMAVTAGAPPIAVQATLMPSATVLAACAMQVELGKRKEPEPMLPPPPKPAGAAMPPPGRPAPASMPPPPVQPPSSALPPPVSAPTQLPPPPRPALVSCNSSTYVHHCLWHSRLPLHAFSRQAPGLHVQC